MMIDSNNLVVDSFEDTYLKFFPESLFGLLRVVCYFVELPYPVLNVGCVYPRGIKWLLFKLNLSTQKTLN